MRKLFLTSGLVLCMASNAIAATDIDSSGQVGGSAATCVYNVLDTYEGSSSFDAKWTPINYTVTFQNNTKDTSNTNLYGTLSGTLPGSETYAYDETKNLTSNTATLTGYSFAGWSTTTDITNVNGGSANYTNGQSITYKYPNNATLTAKWDPICSGAITLNANIYSSNNHSGTALYENSSSATNKLDTLLATTTIYTKYNNNMYTGSSCSGSVTASNLVPAKAGYTFGGFYNANGNGIGSTQYITNAGAINDAGKRAVTTSGGTATWYAKWTPNSYKITYADNTEDTAGKTLYGNLSGSLPSQQSYTYDSTANLTSNTATRTGYTFNGWTTTTDVQNVSGGSATYTNGQSVTYKYPNNATLTAKWNPNKSGKITLISSVYPSNDTSQTATYTTSNGVTAATTSTLYSMYNNGLYKNSACTTAMVASEEKPTKTGYTFGGFYDSTMTTQYIAANGTGTDAGARAITTSGGTATWYAKWTAKTVTNGLVYSCGTAPTVGSTQLTLGGSAPSSVNTTYDNSYTLASTTTCALSGTGSAGYHWGGWLCTKNPEVDNSTSSVTYHSANASNAWTVSKTIDKWKATSAVTCSAVWQGNDYTITFAKNTVDSKGTTLANTVTGSTASKTYEYNTGGALTANGFSVTGYTFGGWTGDKNVRAVAGTGTMTYSAGENITYIYPGNATLTAIWNPNKSGKITLDSSVYPSNNTSSQAKYTTSTGVTAPTTTAVYTMYNNGIYSDAACTTAIVANNVKPSKAGYTFGGFYDSTMATQYITAAGAATTSGKKAYSGDNSPTGTWYAKWTANSYDVNYEKGAHGTGQLVHTNGATYDNAYTTKTAAEVGITPDAGYSFSGWSGAKIDGTSGTATYAAGTSAGTYKLTSAWTLTAQYTANAYQITYTCGTAQGTSSFTKSTTGASANTVHNVNMDGTYTLLSNAGSCVLPGYHFNGWHCDYSLDTPNSVVATSTQTKTHNGSATGTFKSAHNVTCNVVWEANTITTNWSANGGSIGTAGGASCTYDGSISLPSNVTKPGYTFTGWTVTNTSN